jgi:xylulokinase
MRQGHETHPLDGRGAKLLGLPAGLPVAGPYIDHEAAYQAAAGASASPLLCSLGTAWVGSYVQPPGAPPEGAMNLVLPSPTGPGDLVLRVMMAGTATWDWALTTLVGGPSSRALARAEAIFRRALLPPEGLLSLPWLTRRNPVDAALAGGGGFVGIGPRTTRADLLRAAAAGLCFELAHTLGPALDAGAIDLVVLCGGAAKGWYNRELIAALLAPRRVAWLGDDQTAAARGSVQSLRTSAARPRVRRVRLPSPPRQRAARDRYERYCRLCQALAAGLGNGRGNVLDAYDEGTGR